MQALNRALGFAGIPVAGVQAAMQVDSLISGINNPFLTVAAAPVFLGTAALGLAAGAVGAIGDALGFGNDVAARPDQVTNAGPVGDRRAHEEY